MVVLDQPRALSKQVVQFCCSHSQVALLQEHLSKEAKCFLGVFSPLFLLLPLDKDTGLGRDVLQTEDSLWSII